MALWQWSKTATSNGTSDPTMNWSEGIPPSIVDDNVRALMARVAEWRDDISSGIVTGGPATAYTLTTNEGFPTPTPNTGQLICFTPNVTNGVGTTLAIDGGSAYQLQTQAGLAIGAGILVAGTPYTAVFTGTAWGLRNFYGNPFIVPIGSYLYHSASTAPNSSFALPFGQAISRTTYATYFALVGTTYGVGDGLTTFNIPDLRGRTLFGLDNMGGSAANRITVAGGNFDGTVLGNTGGAQNHTLTTGEMPVHNHGITDPGHTHPIPWPANSALINTSAGGNPASGGGESQNGVPPNTSSNTTGITINNAGSGNAHTILSPAMMAAVILRII